ncbi:uncharacterized protein LOC110373487 [Helicoverpa armigera]|uniref:uncharacterized protein LOC110373487 n=1 Tax=Helicoverpa armigera TaxID=29058 RepID=UPI003082FC2A
MAGEPSDIENIDVNSPDFYEIVQGEIESDWARMKKTVDVIMNLRLEAAEIEVETAALFHAELWYDLLLLQDDSEVNSDDEEYEETEDEEEETTTET